MKNASAEPRAIVAHPAPITIVWISSMVPSYEIMVRMEVATQPYGLGFEGKEIVCLKAGSKALVLARSWVGWVFRVRKLKNDVLLFFFFCHKWSACFALGRRARLRPQKIYWRIVETWGPGWIFIYPSLSFRQNVWSRPGLSSFVTDFIKSGEDCKQIIKNESWAGRQGGS